MKLDHLMVGVYLFTQVDSQARPDLRGAIDNKLEFSDAVFWGCVLGASTFVVCCVTFCLYILCKRKPQPYNSRNNHALSGTTRDNSFTFIQMENIDDTTNNPFHIVKT